MPNVSDLIAWENGELNEEETFELFSKLVESGLIYQMQGFYGRYAESLGLL
jgi:hypothetical protein